jgi:hypothetical protein
LQVRKRAVHADQANVFPGLENRRGAGSKDPFQEVLTEAAALAHRYRAAALDSTGRLVMESILETKAATILQFFAGLRGTLSAQDLPL